VDASVPAEAWRLVGVTLLGMRLLPDLAAIGGLLGDQSRAALLQHQLERRWLLRCVGSRELELTPAGRQGLADLLSLEPHALFDAPLVKVELSTR
jgi:hypothetical protein